MEPDLASVAALIAEPNRACMLQVLLSGTPQSGSALADSAGISRALASAHLKKLVAGGLVTAERDGRRQLYSLAGERVADAIEALMQLAPSRPVRSLRDYSSARSMRWARMCYDHLAGTVGLAVTDGLVANGAVTAAAGGFALGPAAADVLGPLGIDVAALVRERRTVVRPCPDLTEGRDHVAGSLAAAVTGTLTALGWTRLRAGSRIVTVTAAGHSGLRDWLGVDLTELRAAA
jgi:DNA-binding transcriptional ArsR family regulator